MKSKASAWTLKSISTCQAGKQGSSSETQVKHENERGLSAFIAFHLPLSTTQNDRRVGLKHPQMHENSEGGIYLIRCCRTFLAYKYI